MLVSLGVWILRVKAPNIERRSARRFAPVVSLLGALICTAMIIGLDSQTLKVAFGWMAVGLVIYFLYGRKRSQAAAVRRRHAQGIRLRNRRADRSYSPDNRPVRKSGLILCVGITFFVLQ